jgi:hypothetical protein
MVSASNATDPEITTITSCAAAVAPSASRLIFHRADTGRAGFQRPIDAVGGVVAVRSEHLPHRRTEPAAVARLAVPIPVVVLVIGAVLLCVMGHARFPLCRAGVGSEALSGCRVRSSSVLR